VILFDSAFDGGRLEGYIKGLAAEIKQRALFL
jgi:hypothetical protein